jgi:hypothetical protein
MLTEAVERVEGQYTMERSIAINDELFSNHEMEVLQILVTTWLHIDCETISRL